MAVSTVRRAELRFERGFLSFFSRIAVNPLRYAAGSILLGLLIGGTVYSFIEDETTIVDGVWWAFVSMTTVGYGDIAPKKSGVRVLAAFVIATGIAATAILTAALAGRIAEARMRDAAETYDLDDDFDELAARLQGLKARYVEEERYDDLLVRRAALAVEAWRAGGDEHAIRELAACLDEHPEWVAEARGRPSSL